MKRLAVTFALAFVAAAVALAGEDREKKVRDDKDKVGAMDSWIYDDLPRGIEEAKKTGKPLLVVFRCIPCEACAKLDEDVVTRDPIVRAQLDKFVCVRIPHMNGVDISIFQFDYDQSWSAFMMNADMLIYGRYGTRSSQKDSANDVSLEGFATALSAGLDIHVRRSTEDLGGRLRGKQPNTGDLLCPEDLPSLKGKYTSSLDWQGKVVQSCVHCHMVGEAQRKMSRARGEPIPENLLFPYPNPRVLGLVMDPKAAARVKSVTPDSAAAKARLQAGDEIREFDGQSILSVADLQWALHRMNASASFDVIVERDGKLTPPARFELAPGWRTADDISWRASSWDLRRMTTGGMLLEAVSDADRTSLGIAAGKMALRAKHIGQYGEHAAAKNAGFVKGDVIVAVNGRDDVMTETAWLTWLVNAKKPGEKVPVTLLRGGKRVELTLPMQ